MSVIQEMRVTKLKEMSLLIITIAVNFSHSKFLVTYILRTVQSTICFCMDCLQMVSMVIAMGFFSFYADEDRPLEEKNRILR